MLRLLLALLFALAATPMPAAACEEAPSTMAAMPGHAMHATERHAPTPAPAPAPHDCIGCVAVADWNADRVAAPGVMPSLPPLARVAALSLQPGDAPVPPPPKVA